jgi:uncharacterized membrane protein YeaQ/YmgE (transglycosylase-associated protein family)
MNTTLTHLLASPVTVIGLATILALYAGKLAQKGRLPSIIGFMLLGAILGPSVVHLLTEELQEQLGFINDIALGFVALSIGLELSFTALKRHGEGDHLHHFFGEHFHRDRGHRGSRPPYRKLAVRHPLRGDCPRRVLRREPWRLFRSTERRVR